MVFTVPFFVATPPEDEVLLFVACIFFAANLAATISFSLFPGDDDNELLLLAAGSSDFLGDHSSIALWISYANFLEGDDTLLLNEFYFILFEFHLFALFITRSLSDKDGADNLDQSLVYLAAVTDLDVADDTQTAGEGTLVLTTDDLTSFLTSRVCLF